jgi:hypothetical protein
MTPEEVIDVIRYERYSQIQKGYDFAHEGSAVNITCLGGRNSPVEKDMR